MTSRLPPEPAVAVVVPCAGDLADLPELVKGLLSQEVAVPWRVIFVDNGLAPGPRSVLERECSRLLRARIVEESTRGIGPARNAGVAASRAEVLVFVDADDIPAPGWLSALVGAVEPGTIVGGHLETRVLNPIWLADTRGPPGDGTPYLCEGIFPVAPGGNMAITRRDFEAIGGFAHDARPLEDFDLCLRAWEHGVAVRVEPSAVLHYRLRSRPRDLYRQGFNYGRSRARVYRDLVDRGLVPNIAVPGWRSWVRLILALPPSLVRHRSRATAAWIAGNRFGRAVGSLRYRVGYL